MPAETSCSAKLKLSINFAGSEQRFFIADTYHALRATCAPNVGQVMGDKDRNKREFSEARSLRGQQIGVGFQRLFTVVDTAGKGLSAVFYFLYVIHGVFGIHAHLFRGPS